MQRVLILLILIVIIIPSIKSQETVLIVKEFEYIWEREFASGSPAGGKRVILAEIDSIKDKISKSFADAFQERWNITVPAFAMSVRPLGILSNEPKFNTRIKDKTNGNWYLFLQVFDKRTNFSSEDGGPSAYITVKCKLIDGNDEKTIHEKNITVQFYKEATPAGQIAISGLPGYPASYVKAFDSLAQWVFRDEAIINKSVTLEAACLFDESKTDANAIQSLPFESNNETITYTGISPFSFKTSPPRVKRADVRRNRGGNIASGTLTVLTGISTNKSRQYDYEADFSYAEADTAYHCIINYTEYETGSRERVKDESSNSYSFNSSEYGLHDRFIDTSAVNFIRLGNDTIAAFTVQYEKSKDSYSKYSKIWNGKDSASVLPMAENWMNKTSYENVIINGRLESSPFTFKCIKDKKVKQLFIDDKLIAVIYGKNTPSSGFAIQPVSGKQLRIFTILSSLPYNHFNVHNSN